jgi:hypothetical protein
MRSVQTFPFNPELPKQNVDIPYDCEILGVEYDGFNAKIVAFCLPNRSASVSAVLYCIPRGGTTSLVNIKYVGTVTHRHEVYDVFYY